jgi:dUTP pyrophosphatase
MIELKDNDLVFAKVKPNAIIPTKEDENAGRDVYACFDEDYMIIPALTTKLIPTGIASAMTPKYEIRLRDRGSNGSKGIHVNAGTIDSGFRGEWWVCWCNTNNRYILLSKLSLEEVIKKYGKVDTFGDTCIPINPNEPMPFDEDFGTYDENALWVTWKYDDGAAKVIEYPYTKAIAQAEVCEVPVMNQYEITYEELLQLPSKRGTGALGSSGK